LGIRAVLEPGKDGFDRYVLVFMSHVWQTDCMSHFCTWDRGFVLTWLPLSVEKRLKKLDREADNYKNTDQADLAEGLKVITAFNPLVPQKIC
jgi:hypothetical protein